jgi:deoxyribodipyrimidine photolyase-related protein
MNIFLLFPTQLFKSWKLLKDKHVYLIEDPIFFTDYKYHKLKLAYHRATMKYYYQYLKKKHIKVDYIDFQDVSPKFYQKLAAQQIYSTRLSQNVSNHKIEIYQTFDHKLQKQLHSYFKKCNFITHDSPNFLISLDFIRNNKDKFYKNGSYSHAEFYKLQRKRLNILINQDGEPEGGKWTFDEQNREKIPENESIPKMIQLTPSKEIMKIKEEAKEYVLNHFPKNYGSLENFTYPITHQETKTWLHYFCTQKFKKFGVYEDAETMRDPYLFHSVLSPMMNIGLITDKEVLNFVKKYEKKVPISSYEGFIRQIIGWRNYVLTIYLEENPKSFNKNFMNHTNKMKEAYIWSKKETGILPFDYIIQKINDHAYAHHIERLMYIGNLLFLLQIHPKYVFKYFMEWTIDAYDWVMVPNVYCMSQYADGGLMMKKPYFSSYNYILKMSDYKKEAWCTEWYYLYYNLINKHQNYFRKIYGTSQLVKHWENKSKKEQDEIKKNAKKIIKKLCV